MNEFVVTCFADIVDPTSMREIFSQIGSGPINDESLAVCEVLASYNGGNYVRNIDGNNAILFGDLESSLNFACQLQQFYQAQPNYSKPPITPRIRLYLGAVSKHENNAFRPGVNQASLVVGKVEHGTLWLDKGLMEAILRAWGEAKAHPFFSIEGNATQNTIV